jgi:hypothetical protein
LALWTLRRALFRLPDRDPPGMLADFWRTSALFQTRRAVLEKFEGQSND